MHPMSPMFDVPAVLKCGSAPHIPPHSHLLLLRPEMEKKHQQKFLSNICAGSISLTACGNHKDFLSIREWKKFIYYFEY